MEPFDKNAYFLKEEARGCKVIHNTDGSTTVIPPKQHWIEKLRNNAIMIIAVFGILSIVAAIFYGVSMAFNPLLLLLLLPVWILYSMVKCRLKRRYSLKRLGYFGGGREQAPVYMKNILTESCLRSNSNLKIPSLGIGSCLCQQNLNGDQLFLLGRQIDGMR